LFKSSDELQTLEDQGVIKKIYKNDDIEMGNLPTDRTESPVKQRKDNGATY